MQRFVNARVPRRGLCTVEVDGGEIVSVAPIGVLSSSSGNSSGKAASRGKSLSAGKLLTDQAAGLTGAVVDIGGDWLVPAAIDAHVHSRDPGFLHKEDWHALAQGAWQGGVVAVCDMPNTDPPTLNASALELKAVRADQAGLEARFFVGVTAESLDGLKGLIGRHRAKIAGIKIYYGRSTGDLTFSDLDALARALDGHDVLAVFHSEDQCRIDHATETLLSERESNGYDYSLHSRLRDIESALSSTRTILEWARHFRGRVHLAHVSTAGEIELAHEARERGVSVTTEVAPHHLLLSTEDYVRLGPFLKVNPPVRPIEEVERLGAFFAAGVIDVFATDHAPHTLQEKLRPFGQCPAGMPALEYFFPLFMASAQRFGRAWQDLLPMIAENPARLFGFSKMGRIEKGASASFAVIREGAVNVSSSRFVTKCGWSPYAGMSVPGEVLATIYAGNLKFSRPS